MAQVSITIDDDQLAELDGIADDDQRSRASLIRKAVAYWLGRPETAERIKVDPDDMIPVDPRGMTVVEEGEQYEVDGLQRYVSYCGCTDGRHKGVYRSREAHTLPTDWDVHPVNVVAYEIVEAQ